jgi:hypothetical protein
MDTPEEHGPVTLASTAIRSLFWIIMTAVLLIGVISIANLFITSGLVAAKPGGIAEAAGRTDEALSILGNIASASVGGLVGWLSRDFVIRRRGEDLDVVSTRNTTEHLEMLSGDGTDDAGGRDSLPAGGDGMGDLPADMAGREVGNQGDRD